MSRDIAVICATPPGTNPGMDSVDLAFVQLAIKHGFDDRISLQRLYPAGNARVVSHGRSFAYSLLPGRAFFPSQRAIVYWGDFLHMRPYQLAAAHYYRLAHASVPTVEEAQERVHDAFLLKGQDTDVFRRTLSFGTTMFVNGIRDEQDGTYGPLLERFLKNSRRVWFRDVMSAIKACHLRGDYRDSCLGVDCATTIDPAQFGSVVPPENRRRLGVFVGRTTYPAYVESMGEFAVALASALDLIPSWIAWGDAVAFPPLLVSRASKSIPSLDGFSVDSVEDPLQALSNLLQYRVIVSDTYHVCVNAWNLGIPAVCLAENEFSQTRNRDVLNYFCRRDKRHLFMSMYDALDYFVPTNELVNLDYRNARIAHIAQLQQSGRESGAIHERIRSHARAAESAFVTALRELL